MSDKPDHDPGIEHEPHLRGQAARGDASEPKADDVLRREGQRGRHARDRALQSVHAEPFTTIESAAGKHVIDDDYPCAQCGYNLRGLRYGERCPECGHNDAMTYAQWLADAQARVTNAQSWIIAAVLALLGGPLAVVGTLWAMGDALAIIIVGPTAEEILKVVAVVMLVEIRPHLIRFAVQIPLIAIGSAVGFAVIENLLYLNVYIPNPPPGLVLWRWTICIALHVGCTAIASIGVLRAWKAGNAAGKPPDATAILPWLVAAIILHGAYNAFAVALELTGFRF
jgi:hypothetical protein